MFRVKFSFWNCAKLQVEKIYLIILFFVVAAHRNIWKTFVCFREINIPFGAIMELINKTQDKWIFLTELWKKLFRTTFSNCTTNGKSLIFSYNPAQIFHSLDENTQKNASDTSAFGSTQNREIFQFIVWIMIFSSSDSIQCETERNLLNFYRFFHVSPAFQFFLFFHSLWKRRKHNKPQ